VHKIKPKYSYIGIISLHDDIVRLHKNALDEINLGEIPDLVSRIVEVSEKAFVELKDELQKIEQIQ